MNNIYSPVNVNITTIKYQNFAPYISKDQPSSSPVQNIELAPTISFLLLNSLSQSLTPPPIFSDDDFKLIGVTKDPITDNVSLNDHKKIMKVINYGSNKLFDKLTKNPTIETSSLEDNKSLYLPDCIVPYIKYLNDMNILQSFIDINKINNINDIASQFNEYLRGLLISYTKPSTNNFRLQREIVIVFTSDKKNIVNIQFNETISYLDNNKNWQSNYTSNNINTKYDYFIINSYLYDKENNAVNNFITNITNTVKIFGSALKSRQLIDDYDIYELEEKIKNINTHNILYVNYYLKTKIDDEVRFGIQLVKRVNDKIIFMNYFDIKDDFKYYKNMCPNPATQSFYKGRCYENCPNNYYNIGLSCVLNDETNSHEVNKLFNPESNFCKQLCARSNDDISRYETIMQQACWCDTVSCNKCGDFSVGQCNC
jgi:hypothetical protein